MSLQNQSYALLSVSDKTGLIELAQTLVQHQINLIATGKTYEFIKAAQLPVISVAEFNDFPEILGGRVKTLNSKIFAGILAQINIDDEIMQAQRFSYINYVIVNLYPFVQTIANIHTFDDAIEQIDIGGVSLIRAAAKNFMRVTVLSNPTDYPEFIKALNAHKLDNALRKQWAAKAFALTSAYDQQIATYFNHTNPVYEQSKIRSLDLEEIQPLRYGENPHQTAGVYQQIGQPKSGLLAAEILQGKALSYNNFLDTDCAWQVVNALTAPGCAIIKHANPCGVAEAATSIEAYQKAFAANSTSAFGGIIAFNSSVDEQTAQEILRQQFFEVLIAPSITEAARKLFQQKPAARILILAKENFTVQQEIRSINGGYLIQTAPDLGDDQTSWTIVTKAKPTEADLIECYFAWQIVKFVKSNAIVISTNRQSLGIGAGQTSRIDSVKIAVTQALESTKQLSNAVLASDAFFPFADSLILAAEYGIKTIIQPGGSIRDEEVIQKADELGIAMIFTHKRYFRH